MKIFAKIKQFATGKKSKEALEMWDKLSNKCVDDPEFHPSLNIDIEHYLRLNTQKKRNAYLYTILKKRQKAREDSIYDIDNK